MTSQKNSFQKGPNGPLSDAAVERLRKIKADTGMSYATLGAKLGLSGTFTYNLMNKGMNVGTQHIARMQGAVERMEQGKDLEPSVKKAAGKNLLSHSFYLRSDLQVSIDLPIDLSDHEAERLGIFIKSLPTAQSVGG